MSSDQEPEPEPPRPDSLAPPPGDLPGEIEPLPSSTEDWSLGLPEPVSTRRAGRSLTVWLILLLVFGVGGLVFGMQELSLMTAFAGLFVLSQAADVDPEWRYLHYAVTWVVPFAGVAGTAWIGYQLFQQVEIPNSLRVFLWFALPVTAATCVLSFFRPFANLLVTLMFRAQGPSHTLRLVARIVVAILALAIPGWFALRSVFEELFGNQNPLVDRAVLEGQLAGYIVLSLAAVGFLIRRNPRETLARLGLVKVSAAQLAVVAIGVVALYGINAGADWIQQTYFKDLWEFDHHVNELTAKGLGPVRIVILGLSAGVGEELTLRGALQPKLGILMTSLVFASLHLQYSWFGILVVFLLSLVLGTIRARTNTATSMAVHVIYDIAALVSV